MIWHTADIQEVCSEMQVDPATGLFSDDADARRMKYGLNRLNTKKSVPFSKRLVKQLRDPLILVLFITLAAALVIALFREEGGYFMPLGVCGLILFKIVLSILRSMAAGRLLDSMRSEAAPTVTVRRDRILKTVPAVEVTRGDILVLGDGDYIAADARLISSTFLRVDEMPLTGETVPVEKDAADITVEDITPLEGRRNMIYGGCTVLRGNAEAVVVATGIGTEMARIARRDGLVDDNSTPVLARVERIATGLGWAALLLSGLVFLIGAVEAFFHRSDLDFTKELLDQFVFSVTLAASIPTGVAAVMEAVLTVTMHSAMKSGLFIKRLSALETLASTTLVCGDKSAVFTQNDMEVTDLVLNSGEYRLPPEELPDGAATLFTFGALCCDVTFKQEHGRTAVHGNATDTAIVSAGMKYIGLTAEALTTTYTRLTELPFDSVRRTMATVNMVDGQIFAIVKGAPEVILASCDSVSDPVKTACETMAGKGLHTIAVAYKPLHEMPINPTAELLENGLTFAGLIGLNDLPRDDAAETVALCRESGIRTLMFSGDHPLTALSLARTIGIADGDSSLLTGEELAAMTEEELDRRLDEFSVFARFSGEDRLRIVEAWKKKGETVLVTGGRVEDAASLQAADIPCALEKSGTDVARGVSDIVLNSDGYAALFRVIHLSKDMFRTLRHVTEYLLCCGLGRIFAVLLGIIFFQKPILTAPSLLWVALLTDVLPAIALGFDRSDYGPLPPANRKKNEGLIRWQHLSVILEQSFLIGLAGLFGYLCAELSFHDRALSVGAAFAVIGLATPLILFSIRAGSRSFFRSGKRFNPVLLITVLCCIGAVLLTLATPIGIPFGMAAPKGLFYVTILLISILPLAISEAAKAVLQLIRHIKAK